MTEGKVERLANQMAEYKNKPVEQNRIFATLFARIASAFEYNEPGTERVISPTRDPAWQAANEHLLRIAKIDPELAIQTGIDLAYFPRSQDERQEKINKWIRTAGLSFLGDDAILKPLRDYFEIGRNNWQLADILIENFKPDVSGWIKNGDFGQPEGFTAVQSIYIALGLEGTESEAAEIVHRAAERRKSDPDIKEAVNIIKTFPGCEYITSRF